MKHSKSNEEAILVESSSSSSSDDEDDSDVYENSEESSSISDSDNDNDNIPTSAPKPLPASNKAPRSLRMPNGLLLQHHLCLIKPDKEEVEKKMKMNNDFFSFTKKEDDIIRRNWENYARRNKISGGIFDFIEINENGLDFKKQNRDLWASLSHGLDDRYARMVQMRVTYIFHPYYKQNEDYVYMEKLINHINLNLAVNQSKEIGNSLKIPPRYVERQIMKWREQPKNEPKTVEGPHRIQVLRILYDSVIENGNHSFLTGNFDWEVFSKKCIENSIPQYRRNVVNETMRNAFKNIEKEIFQYLEPKPTLKNKILYIHEASVRYVKTPIAYPRKTNIPLVRRETVFTVVFEDYNKNGNWDPPSALQFYGKTLNLEEIRQKVQKVQESRKRVSKLPKARFSVVEKKKQKLDDIEKSTDTTENRELEVSSIRGESSSASSMIGISENQEDEDLTEFEVSTRDNSSTFLYRNETILAAGGGAKASESNLNDTSLGGTVTRSQSKRKEEFKLDMSLNVWDQLMSQ